MNEQALEAWAAKAPPPSHWVAASYGVLEPLQVLKTCKRGCCVHGAFGTMRLPLYWRHATTAEAQNEQAKWDAMPEIDMAQLF